MNPTASAQQIVVASKNPVKIGAALAAFGQSFPDREFAAVGISVESRVNDQPASDDETRLGAENRALEAERLAVEADYWVGIEGGIEANDDQMLAFAWVVIRSADPKRVGKSRSGAFLLPPRVQALVREGHELGHANGIVFAQHNSKQRGGAIGLLTGDVIGRQQLYEHAVVLALVPFISAELFSSNETTTA